MLPHPYPISTLYYYPQQQTLTPAPYIIFPYQATTINSHLPIPPPALPILIPPQIECSNYPGVAKGRQKRIKNAKRQRISARKNSESNIINHYFSYYSTKQGSQAIVAKITASLQLKAQNEQLIGCLYNAIRSINLKRGKNYINNAILNSYFTEQGLRQLIPEFIQKVHSCQICRVQELSEMLRKTFYFFLRQACFCCLLTSKRISLLSKEAHLDKRRKMLRYMKRKGEFD